MLLRAKHADLKSMIFMIVLIYQNFESLSNKIVSDTRIFLIKRFNREKDLLIDYIIAVSATDFAATTITAPPSRP